MERIRIYVCLALTLVAGVILAMNMVKVASSSVAKKKKAPLSNREKMGIYFLALIAATLHCLFSKNILAIILGAILLIGCFIAADTKKKLRSAKIMFLAGLPALVAIIVDVIFDLFAKNWKSLVWLLVPVAFCLFLRFYGQMGMEKVEKPEKEKEETEFVLDFGLPLALTVIFTAGIIAAIVFMSSKGVI